MNRWNFRAFRDEQCRRRMPWDRSLNIEDTFLDYMFCGNNHGEFRISTCRNNKSCTCKTWRIPMIKRQQANQGRSKVAN